jgi:acetyl esterase/lipase
VPATGRSIIVPRADSAGSRSGGRRRAHRRARFGLLSLLAICALGLLGTSSALAAPSGTKVASEPNEGELVFYGPLLAQRAHVYPSSKPGSATVILVHGGGWRKQTGLYYLRRESLDLQAKGFTVFNINYRQATFGRPAFPIEPNEVMAAVRFATEHAASYNADPTKVVLVGGSAGANIVSLAAEKLDAARPGTVRAVVSLSGPMNLETLVAMVMDGTITNQTFISSIAIALGGNEESFAEPEWAGAIPKALEQEGSPVFNIPGRGCPGWLLYTAENDGVPASQSREMYSDLLAAHCRASLVVLPGTSHGFAYWPQVSEAVASYIAAETA